MSFAAATASRFVFLPIRCSDTDPRRGFGANPGNDSKKRSNKGKKATGSRENKGLILQQRTSTPLQPDANPAQAPGLSSQFGAVAKDTSRDSDFEKRLKAIKKAALEKKKTEEKIELGAIDYDAPIESDKKTIGLGTQIGVGVAVAVFGLVFALGDFIPSGSVSPSEQSAPVANQLSNEEEATLQSQLREYEATLSTSPKDPTALEGAAVTLAELGDFTRSASLLQDLAKEKPGDPEVYRLLGDVTYQLRDFEASANAYKKSAEVSKYLDFDVLRGRTNALLEAKKPDEAVQFLLASRERVNKENSDAMETGTQKADPIQVELLLGKAYSDWGHVSDAVTVYDQLISSHPNDFRGYLAKGIILKENGNVGDSERMFIQARFFAPEKAKALVDRYAGR